MNKKTKIITALIIVIAIVCGSVYMAYITHQKQAAADQQAKKEAEEQANKEAEEQAEKEQEQKEVEQQVEQTVNNTLDQDVTEEINKALPEEYQNMNQEFLNEAKAITEVLVRLNMAENNTHYTTTTGLEGIEYMTEKYAEETKAEADKIVEYARKGQAIVTFLGLEILEMSISEDKATVVYDVTTDRQAIDEDVGIATLRCESSLIKKDGKWLVDNEELLGRVVDDENTE